MPAILLAFCRPTQKETGKHHRPQKRSEETKEADGKGRSPMLAQSLRFNLCPCKESEEDASQARQEVDPIGWVQVQQVTCQRADDDFHKGNGNRRADGEPTGG